MVEIRLDAVSVRMGWRDIVRQISSTLAGGSLIGIIGPNGAGKSTLVRAIMGLRPLSSGQIHIDGIALDRLSARNMARRIAYLPQGQTLHWPLAVERLVALGRLPHLAPFSRLSDADHAAIQQAMQRTDVSHLKHRDATSLSGGEYARVMLARALAAQTGCLIADEPLVSLDPGHQIDVMALLQAEAKAGALVVAVLHDLSLAARYCDRLLLIDGGKLRADGPPAHVLSAENLAQVYGVHAMLDFSTAQPLVLPLGRIAASDTVDEAALHP